MSDLSTPPFDLSLLGISDRLPNDSEVTPEDADTAFTDQVQSVVRDLMSQSTSQSSASSAAEESGAEVDDPSGDTESGVESDPNGTSTLTDVAPDSLTREVTESSGDAEGESDSAPDSPSYLTIPLNDGSTYDLSIDAATDLLRLNAWAQSLPETTRYAFAAIESGQAVAIPVKDYASFTQWQQEQTTRPSLADELEDLDPNIARRVREMEAKIASIPDPGQQQQQYELQQRMSRVQSVIDSTLASYQQANNLTDTDMQALVATTADLGIIARLTEQNTLRAPNGEVLREADHAAVLRRSLDMVRSGGFVPTVSHASIPAPSAPVGDPSPTPAPSSTLPSVSQRVSTKKARASSLSSAPSSAVTQPRSTDPLSPVDMEAAVRNALADAMRNGS